ncbi:hypothetical protein RIF29_03997 [Crotalaria pallida]|uniref:Uncharacterized protein n=1 Tax=Crotalaria pallida TaxID=3830 RepID=A0AAN9P9M1_CROPI
MKFPASVSAAQNMLGSLCTEGSSGLLNLSRSGQFLLTEHLPQQTWSPKYAPLQVNAFGNTMSHPQYSRQGTCNSDTQNPTLFGVNIDSSGLLLPIIVPGYANSSADTDALTMALGESGFRGPLYACMQD